MAVSFGGGLMCSYFWEGGGWWSAFGAAVRIIPILSFHSVLQRMILKCFIYLRIATIAQYLAQRLESTAHLDSEGIFSPIICWVITPLLSSYLAVH